MNLQQLKWSHWLLLAILLALLTKWFWPTPEAQIRRQLRDLAQHLQLDGKESPLNSAHNAQKLGEFFAPEVTAEIHIKDRPQYFMRKRSDVVDATLLLRRSLKYFQVEFIDTQVRLENDSRAQVTTTAKARFDNEDRYFDAIELEIIFVFEEGRWRIKDLKTVQAIAL